MEILDTGFDMDAYEMKKHMFTVTTMTPKLCDALQVVEAMFEEDRRHWWTSYLAADVLNTCIHYVQATIMEASHVLNIPVKILYRCDALYAVQDAVMKTSNRKEDVSQWSLAFALAIYEEKRGFADQVIRCIGSAGIHTMVFQCLPRMNSFRFSACMLIKLMNG